METCPLSGGAYAGEIPATCFDQCADLWDKAITTHQTAGEYDQYKRPEDFDEQDECRHEDTGIQFSSEGLQSVDLSTLRLYAIVDECMSCGQEFGEQAYEFQCPYNGDPDPEFIVSGD